MESPDRKDCIMTVISLLQKDKTLQYLCSNRICNYPEVLCNSTIGISCNRGIKRNHIKMNILKRDSIATVESYKINDFKTVKNPYEGHYVHYETVVGKSINKLNFWQEIMWYQHSNPA